MHDRAKMGCRGMELVDPVRIAPTEDEILQDPANHSTYTEIGEEGERAVLEALRSRPWREVVRSMFERARPWLCQIITSPLRARMLDVLELPAEGRFLDVGSGWGALSIPLARRGQVAALDLTIPRLQILREIARQEGVRLSYHCGDLKTYPFREKLFDGIFFNGSLEYMLEAGTAPQAVASQAFALRRAGSLLREGGVIYLGIENSVGLKYLLGAPDDHAGKPFASFVAAEQDAVAARTWSLDRYHELFASAGLELAQGYACFPDYKLIRRMVPLEEVDAFLAEQGLPASEHNGVDGAPLGLDRELDALYRIFGRAGIARHLVPSYAFVLRPLRRALHAPAPMDRIRDVLRATMQFSAEDESAVRIVPVERYVRHRWGQETQRFHIYRGETPTASIKRIPLVSPFNPDAILETYRRYGECTSFRSVRLLGATRDAQALWLVEEFMPSIRSLDELVRSGVHTPDEATACMIAVVDDILVHAEPLDPALLERELADLRDPFRAVIDNESVAAALYEAFCRMMRGASAGLSTVLSTRDYIGRNIVLAPDGRQVLLDFDLATRTTLFALDVARNRIHVPYCTERLYDAHVFQGLDRRLVEIAAVAAECELQSKVQPESLREHVRRRHRLLLLQLLDPHSEVIDEAGAARTGGSGSGLLPRAPQALAAGGDAADVAEVDPALESDTSQPTRLTGLLVERNALRTTLEDARSKQRELESQLAAAQTAEADLRRKVELLRYPHVDVMLVNYNGLRWIDGFVRGLTECDYPRERLRLIFVDNASSDGSLEEMKRRMADLPIESEFVQTGVNAGFTGGYQAAFEKARADYLFVINTDTVMAPDAISRLIEALEGDPTAGIAEARQSPHEHPKYYDPITRETSWCSGACMMVRARAVQQIGGGFDPIFYMYAEDVDLSWRMWLHGWRCIYVAEAVVQHFTEHLDPRRDMSFQHYFCMRNGALMRVMYGSFWQIVVHYLAMLRIALKRGNPGWHRWLTLKSIFTSFERLPRAWRGRRIRARRGAHPWVFFDGWLYGRHLTDLALTSDSGMSFVTDLHTAFDTARKRMGRDVDAADHIVRHPQVYLAGRSFPAVVVFDTAEITLDVSVPQESVISGFVAAPQDTWATGAMGRFEILQDGATIWSHTLDLDRADHRSWIRFEAPLQPTGETSRSEVTLRFRGLRNLAWGVWGHVRVGYKTAANELGLSPAGRSSVPDVSIVMPTHNRADGLERVIRRIMAQDLSPDRFEVIVVDSNSRDHTPHKLAELARQYPNFTGLRCEKSGAAAARNMGMERARGRLVLLLDDDILVAPGFLRIVAATHRRHPDRVLLGRIEAPWEGTTNPFHRYLLQAQDVNVYDFPDNQNVPANYFFTACVAIPRNVLGDTRFDEGFRVYGVEDIDFGFRLLAGETRMIYCPDIRVWHEYYPSYRPYHVKKYKAGYSLGYFTQQNPQHAHRFVFEAQYRRFYHLLRFWHALTAPFAGLRYFWECVRYESGPVKRGLYNWIYRDLRLTLYAGVRRFARGAPPP